MKNKIPQFLKEKLTSKSYPSTKNFPNEIKKFMMDYAKFYSWNIIDLTKIFNAMKKGISELPVCGYDDCNKHVYFNWENKLTLGCCQNHSTKISLLKSHGVENNSQRDDVKIKKIETCLEKYGVENPSQVKKIRKKAEQTMMEKYGFSNPSHSSKIIEKKKLTYLEKYGETNPNKVLEIQEKIKKTNLKKYGVTSPLLKNDINTYRKKEYKWESGEISILQGHKPIVLGELEKRGYSFEDIKTNATDKPVINYFFKNKNRRYYPDFYIPSENLIIEVKSDYTLMKDWEMNQAKFKAVKEAGFEFRLEVR